jgi:Flp pilus assembly protein CpaB
MEYRPYINPGRLADVLALIQVLALDDRTHRSESGLSRELQVVPRSAASWLDVADEHPEFFRVAKGKKSPLSLVARHVLPEDDDEERRVLPADFTRTLLETALELHDREVEAAYRAHDADRQAWVSALRPMSARREPRRFALDSASK